MDDASKQDLGASGVIGTSPRAGNIPAASRTRPVLAGPEVFAALLERTNNMEDSPAGQVTEANVTWDDEA